MGAPLVSTDSAFQPTCMRLPRLERNFGAFSASGRPGRETSEVFVQLI